MKKKLLKSLYDEVVKKFNAIRTTDTGDLVKKAGYKIKIGEIEKKILIMSLINILLLNDLIS